MSDFQKITRAIVSVSDKTGLVDFVRKLATFDVQILSTGGSAAVLREAGIAVTDVSDYTGFPEILDGRVKTLHPRIHGGLLQRLDSDAHREDVSKNNIPAIDMVVSNLYPFRKTVAKGAAFDECIENIDIGGPSMVRSAAKNHAFVTVVTDPSQYDEVSAELERNSGRTSLDFRRKLAAAAFGHTASYDTAVSSWFAAQLGDEYPDTVSFSANKQQALRYGENPHQTAAFYVCEPETPGVANAIQVQGKELSYNNIGDTDAAFALVSEFDEPAVAIIKHANPSGVATASDLLTAYRRAFACDTVSPFGGIIACNRPLDEAVAKAITEIFSEVVIAPDMDDAARAVFAAKKNLRVLLTRTMADPRKPGRVVKSVGGGFLVQTCDNIVLDMGTLQCVTKKQPTEQEMKDLIFAFTVAKHVKSNTIVYAKNLATVGIGAGQMSRVDSARIAARKAEDAAKAAGSEEPLTKGSVAASDAFFPFADGLEALVAAGATAVIQPGGSKRDDEVVQAADKAGIAMVYTGIRHFRH